MHGFIHYIIHTLKALHHFCFLLKKVGTTLNLLLSAYDFDGSRVSPLATSLPPPPIKYQSLVPGRPGRPGTSG